MYIISEIVQAESLRYKLIGGLAVRRACYGVLRFIMESGAKGCEVSRKETLNLVHSIEQLGGRERKAEGPEGQVHEVCGRSHDPLWRPRQRLCRLCLQTRSPEAGCAWNQGNKVETNN